MRKVKLSVNWFMGMIFFALGMIFIVIGAMTYISESNFKKTSETTTGTIIDIESYRDSDGDTRYEVYVDFKVKGKTYSGSLNYYSADMDIGDSVVIYYNPDNPNTFKGENPALFLLLIFGLGSLFALFGLGFIIIAVRKRMIKNRVLKYNMIIQANISGCEINRNLAVNGRHPYILIATAISPYDGLIYTFKSDSIWNNLTTTIETYNITTVPVYVNPQNYKEYYVDIDSFKRYLGN